MNSKITGGPVEFLFNARVLGKYNVAYYRCSQTGFIQTEDPYWLEEAYSSAITKLDIGLVNRNQTLTETIGKLIVNHFNVHGTFLDYAGGYGLFTRMMRDKGINFYHTDKYCQNLFAENFDLNSLDHEKFNAVTAFEVFEHMADPLREISDLFRYSDNLLFSTELQPAHPLETVDDWWYFSPETGQHISFYNETALQVIATELGCNYYTDSHFLHLFTKNNFTSNPFKVKKDPFLIRKMKKAVASYEKSKFPFPPSLLQKDWSEAKKLIQQNENKV